MSFARGFTLVSVILGVVTIVFAVLCGVSIVSTRAFLADSSTASGRVIALVPRQSCEDDDRDQERTCTTVYAPRVRFTTADGQRITFESATASSPPEHSEGDRVDVRYRTDKPMDAKIDSVSGIWLSSIVTGFLGLLFAGCCAVFIVLAVRFRKY